MIPVKLSRQRYGDLWLARARAFGKTFEGEGAFAVQTVARELMAAGIEDQPLNVHQSGVAEMLPVVSFRQLAEGTPVGV